MLDEFYQRLSAARPFLRWVGGKQLFVARYGHVLPTPRNRYFEPFLGSGAVFFHLQRRLGRPLEAVLGDVNVPLVRSYFGVRADSGRVAEALIKLKRGFDDAATPADYYYALRNRFNEQLPSPDAALFIFINRTCWNGLYRVNKRGQFNVPIGRLKGELMLPTENDLVNVAASLARVKLKASNWDTTISSARPGDFIFLDPPYFSDLDKGDTKYQRSRFGLREHRLLATRLANLSKRGVDFVLTNSSEQDMRDLYRRHGLGVTTVLVPRSVSGKIDQRRPVEELIVVPPARLSEWQQAAATVTADIDPSFEVDLQVEQTSLA